MISLLIAVAALSLAVIVSAIIEPWSPVGTNEEDYTQLMNAVALSA